MRSRKRSDFSLRMRVQNDCMMASDAGADADP
jgi:hypothetical protein